MADQDAAGRRASTIQLVQKVRQVIFKLTDVGDIAAGAGRAMTAQVWRISVEATLCQGLGDLVHVGAAAHRSVDQYSGAAGWSGSGGIDAICQRGLIPRRDADPDQDDLQSVVVQKTVKYVTALRERQPGISEPELDRTAEAILNGVLKRLVQIAESGGQIGSA
jgi:hypothetical protein